MMHDLAKLVMDFVQSYGVAAVFILMTAESCLIPIPSEVTMPFAGFMAGQGLLSFPEVVIAGAVGNLVGSLLAYWLGSAKGEPWTLAAIRRWGKWLLVKESDYEKGKIWLIRYGKPVAFFSRLLPIVRTYVSLPAGIAKTNLWSFAGLTFLGSLIWSTLLAYAGYQLGQNWTLIEPWFRKFQYVIIAVIVLAIAAYVWSHLRRRGEEKQTAEEEKTTSQEIS